MAAEAAASAAASAAVVEIYKDTRTVAGFIQEVIDIEKNLDKNYENLNEKAKKLYARRDDVLAKLHQEKTKRATKECEVWIANVNRIEQEVLSLEAQYSEETKNQAKTIRFLARSTLSKSLLEKHEEVQLCWAEGSNFATEVIVERAAESVIKVKAPKIEDKYSLYSKFEKILEFLREKDVKKIGVWGMVGVGKTAIMQNLNNSEHISKTFDMVIFATLTGDGSEGKLWHEKSKLKSAEEKLQRQIAERLKLNLEGITDFKTIALRISKELEGMRYLLLLDDVWGSFNLDDIGISDNEMDSKVVMASRRRDVCRDMDVDELINVEPLSKADALGLFREKLGEKMKHSEFEKVAELVVRECSYLPLLIERVAGFFKKRHGSQLWWAGLRSLQEWPDVKFQGMDEVLELLTFCYEGLEDEDEKLCFLYSALYPEGYEIYTDYLLECWRAEGFTHDVGKFTARHRGQIILDDLVSVSLLERGEKMKHIRMNKVLRNMAIRISSQNENMKCLVRAGGKLQDPPEEKEWKQAKRISLMDNKLQTLPERPDCSNLSTLFLQKNACLETIPDLFFGSMESLRVLDLHATSISAVPSSLGCLKCLRALYLNSCRELSELPSEIDALQHLEVLDIRGTGVKALPIQIGSLSQLRCLRLSLPRNDGKSRKVEFSLNVISKLSSLEELVLDVHPENQWWNQVVKAIVDEVASLRNLSFLSFCFPDVDSLETFIAKSSVWKDSCFEFHFSVGLHSSFRYEVTNYHSEYEMCGCLRYVNGEGITGSITEVLGRANAFELIGHKGALGLSDFGINNISNIRSCLIEGCNEMETIIDSNGIAETVVECLEKMYVSNVQKLESIWQGPVPAGSLGHLTTLIFANCPKLKKIFSAGMIQQLSKLEHLEVRECHDIEEIIMETENVGLEPCALPSLKTLILLDLPKLVSIWIDDSLQWPSLQRMKIEMCALLRSYPSV